MVAAMKTAPAVMAPQGVESPEPNIKALEDALAAPFEPSEVKWKAQAVSKEGSRALAVAFVDARVVQDRLDDVLGVMGWQDSYEVLPDGAVVCRLRVRLVGLGEWITKEDVGGQSEQPDEGDRRKASFSDALKRAAVKFGIGRYLYRLPQQWVDYDGVKKRFTRTPDLPDWALPRAKPAAAEPRLAPGTAPKKPAKTLPSTGEELFERLGAKDKALAAEGLCEEGDLLLHVQGSGMAAGFPLALKSWQGPAIELAVAEVKAFEARAREKPGEALLSTLRRHEAALADAGQATPGELIAHVRQLGVSAQLPDDVRAWNATQVKVARGWAREFIAAREEAPDVPAASQQPDPTSPITLAEATELLALIERKGKTWSEVAKHHGLGSKEPRDLWHAIFQDVTTELNRYPDRLRKATTRKK